jgi:hypothetical protein
MMTGNSGFRSANENAGGKIVLPAGNPKCQTEFWKSDRKIEMPTSNHHCLPEISDDG